MENEIMNYEEEVMDLNEDVCETTESSGMSTGVAMAIGAGVTAAVYGAVKLGKFIVAKVKAHREVQLHEDDFVDVTDEEEDV